MSTKIYEAYRLKRGVNVWQWAREVKIKATEFLEDCIYQICKDATENPDWVKKINEERKKDGIEERTVSILDAYWYLQKYYHESVTKFHGQRHPFNFDISFAIHEHKGRYYVIPYCDAFMLGDAPKTLDFLRTDSSLENFAYWDNSDPDEEVPVRQWNHRAKVWDYITDNWYPLCVDICTYDIFYKFSPVMRMTLESREKIQKELDKNELESN